MSRSGPSWQRMLAVTAPLMLATVEVFHPQPHDLLTLDLTRWMAVHYVQLALFPLAALSQCSLVVGSGLAARICRFATCVFAVSYVAFDAAAGVVTGVLVSLARATGAPESWRPAIMAIWNHPVVGGSSEGAPALAVIGTMAWLVGSLSAAIALRRAGQSWLPTIALIASALGLLVCRTHAWPGGPLTFGALALAAATTR